MTISCLTSLHKAKIPNDYFYEIFMVDDNSSDGTAEAVKSQFSNVNIINGSGHLYWNRGMHLAWKTAISYKKYDYYLWLNDDVIINSNSILNLIKDSTIFPKSIICGSLKSKLDQNQITYGGRNSRGDLILPSGKPRECKYINGNMVFIPKIVVKSIGILDPFYPHAIGDYEYGLRAIKTGYKCFVSSDFVGNCEKNVSLPKWCLSKVNLWERIKSLYSPLGNSHPYYFFVFQIKYFGVLTALKNLISIHTRALFPNLWRN